MFSASARALPNRRISHAVAAIRYELDDGRAAHRKRTSNARRNVKPQKAATVEEFAGVGTRAEVIHPAYTSPGTVAQLYRCIASE